MNGTLPQLGALLTAGLVLGCLGLALREWGALTSSELAPARRPAFILAAAALALVALMAALQAVAFGPASLWAYLGGGGSFLLLQALALPLWTGVGAWWGWRTGVDPFPACGPRPWRAVRVLGAVLGLMLLWTALLVRCWPHRIHAAAEPLLTGARHAPPELGWPYALALLTLAPILEETLFRHYLLNRLVWGLRTVRAPRLWATVLTSLLWALGHQGLVEPYALKVVQVFGIGLGLGWVVRRHGLYAAIAVHGLFNIALIPLLAVLGR